MRFLMNRAAAIRAVGSNALGCFGMRFGDAFWCSWMLSDAFEFSWILSNALGCKKCELLGRWSTRSEQVDAFWERFSLWRVLTSAIHVLVDGAPPEVCSWSVLTSSGGSWVSWITGVSQGRPLLAVVTRNWRRVETRGELRLAKRRY